MVRYWMKRRYRSIFSGILKGPQKCDEFKAPSVQDDAKLFPSRVSRVGDMAKKTERLVLGLLVFLLLGLNACASGSRQMAANPKATVIPEKLYPAVHKEEGSIWPGETSKNMLFEDARGKQIGDIITILVSENATSSQTATTNTQKSSTLNLRAGGLLGLPSNLGLGNFLGSGNGFNPSIDGKSDTTNKGEGTTTRRGTLTATISATVVEVLPSGNLKVEGKRMVHVNNENQTLILKGIVRTMDINFDNTVSSALVANAEITYEGEGVLTDKQRVGWGMRILDWIWPF